MASDSDDEKRTQKSERAAKRKLKVKCRKFGLNGPTGGFQLAFRKESTLGQESSFGPMPYSSNRLPQPSAPRFPGAGPCFKISILPNSITLFYILQRICCTLSRSEGHQSDAQG